MGLFSSIWSGIKSVGKSLLSAFNPFNDDDYRNASREDQDRFKQKIEVISKDESLEHEYRMEAQRVLAKIEAYRHAEEMARIEGNTKITLAKIEASASITTAKLELLRANLEYTSRKELALIRAIESTPNQAPQLLFHLEQAANEKHGLLQHINKDENTVVQVRCTDDKQNPLRLIPPTTIQKERKNEWKVRLVEWARTNQIPRRVLPRKLTRLLRLTSIDLSHYGLIDLPVEIANLTNLKELKLGNNHLTTVPEELTSLVKLTLLDVRGNPITQVPYALCKNKRLFILSDK